MSQKLHRCRHIFVLPMIFFSTKLNSLQTFVFLKMLRLEKINLRIVFKFQFRYWFWYFLLTVLKLKSIFCLIARRCTMLYCRIVRRRSGRSWTRINFRHNYPLTLLIETSKTPATLRRQRPPSNLAYYLALALYYALRSLICSRPISWNFSMSSLC